MLLNAMQAQEAIQRGDFDAYDHDSVYRLYKLAYDNETLARQAQSQAAANLMQREIAKHARH